MARAWPGYPTASTQGNSGSRNNPACTSTAYILTDKTPALRRFVARIAAVDSMFHDSGLTFVRPH